MEYEDMKDLEPGEYLEDEDDHVCKATKGNVDLAGIKKILEEKDPIEIMEHYTSVTKMISTLLQSVMSLVEDEELYLAMFGFSLHAKVSDELLGDIVECGVSFTKESKDAQIVNDNVLKEFSDKLDEVDE